MQILDISQMQWELDVEAFLNTYFCRLFLYVLVPFEVLYIAKASISTVVGSFRKHMKKIQLTPRCLCLQRIGWGYNLDIFRKQQTGFFDCKTPVFDVIYKPYLMYIVWIFVYMLSFCSFPFRLMR